MHFAITIIYNIRCNNPIIINTSNTSIDVIINFEKQIKKIKINMFSFFKTEFKSKWMHEQSTKNRKNKTGDWIELQVLKSRRYTVPLRTRSPNWGWWRVAEAYVLAATPSCCCGRPAACRWLSCCCLFGLLRRHGVNSLRSSKSEGHVSKPFLKKCPLQFESGLL